MFSPIRCYIVCLLVSSILLIANFQLKIRVEIDKFFRQKSESTKCKTKHFHLKMITMHLYFAVRYFWPLLVCRRRHHSDYSVCGTINHAEDSSPWRQNFLTSYQGSLWKKDPHCLLCIRLFHQPYRHDVPHNCWNSRSQFPGQGSQVCPM